MAGAVEVEGETVKLSDLLPAHAPSDLAEICKGIILGNSPLPASQRVFSKGQIEQQLQEFPSLVGRLEIPERVVITCKQRRLSAAEIQAAIYAFLAGEGTKDVLAPKCSSGSASRSIKGERESADHGKQACVAGGMNLRAPVYVTKPDPGLEVKRVELDLVQRKTRFLLWTSKEPATLPFYVTVEGLLPAPNCDAPSSGRNGRDLAAAGCGARFWKAGAGRAMSALSLSSGRSDVASRRVRPSQQSVSPAVMLVAAGKPARLVVETTSLRLTVTVTPLQSGAKGQVIRVRNPDTQGVFEARVVGQDLLGAGFGEEKEEQN